MIPFGRSFLISDAGMSKRTTSEYTWSSRTRRAMTWVYCEPKSRIRIFECFGGAEVFTFAMDESAVRRVRRLDRPALAVRGRFVPDQKRRVQAEIRLLDRFVVRADR